MSYHLITLPGTEMEDDLYKAVRTWLMLLSLSSVFLISCTRLPEYSYNSIQSEYGGHHLRRQDAGRKYLADTGPAQNIEYPLTLQNAISTALKNNPELIGAAWRIEQSKAMLTLAETGFWPQVSLYTEYMQGNAPSAYLFKTIDQRQLSAEANFNEPGWFENYESGIEGRLNLFNGGSDYLSVLMARKDMEISKLDRTRIENDLKAQVIRAFYDILAARDFMVISEESVHTVSEQLRIMRVRHKGGAVVKSDVLSMEVRLAQAREQLVSSTNSFQLALAALTNLLGLEPVDIDDTDDILAPSSTHPDIPEQYEQGLAVAVDRRPELEQARNQLIISRMALTAAKTAYLPRLDLIGKYYMDDSALDYETSRDNWTTALQLNWDLFSGFSRPARVSRAESLVGEMLAVDRKVALAIALDVKRAYLNLEEAVARYRVAQSSVDSAEESFRLVREHYQGGAVTITRYLEAELDRNRSRIRETAARYDRVKALADVARSIGILATSPPAEDSSRLLP